MMLVPAVIQVSKYFILLDYLQLLAVWPDCLNCYFPSPFWRQISVKMPNCFCEKDNRK